MADKETCPACDSTTSAVRRAFAEGRGCPYCGLPCDAAKAFFEAEKRGANEDLNRRLVLAEKARAEAEYETVQLRRKLAEIQRVVETKTISLAEDAVRW